MKPLFLKRLLIRLRRDLFELAGNARYSRPSLDELDRKLERIIDIEGGYFVEAGANDGFCQSNTYYLERFRGWSGVLVEPVPVLFRRCRQLRRKSQVFNCALVAEGFTEKTIKIFAADLMSVVDGSFRSQEQLQEHLREAECHQRIAAEKEELLIPARTLSSVLAEAQCNREIDLLSLDVEGYEAEVLKGLDFARHAPRFILVEAREKNAIEAVLGSRYEAAAVLTEKPGMSDLLYKRK